MDPHSEARDPVFDADQEPLAAARREARRRILKVGLIAVPTILTLKARPVLGNNEELSGLSGMSRPTP